MADRRSTCGQVLPSACVPYTGDKLAFLDEENELACDANINDVFYKIDEALEKLVAGNDFTNLVAGCLTFTPATVTPAQLHAVQIAAICDHKARLTTLEDRLNNLQIQNEIVTINLPACLKPAAAACAVGVNSYQLSALLILFANKLCDLETRLSTLES